jgi:hypothetical protein
MIIKGFYVAKKWLSTYKKFKNESDFSKIDNRVNTLIECEEHHQLSTKNLTRVVILPKDVCNFSFRYS